MALGGRFAISNYAANAGQEVACRTACCLPWSSNRRYSAYLPRCGYGPIKGRAGLMMGRSPIQRRMRALLVDERFGNLAGALERAHRGHETGRRLRLDACGHRAFPNRQDHRRHRLLSRTAAAAIHRRAEPLPPERVELRRDGNAGHAPTQDASCEAVDFRPAVAKLHRKLARRGDRFFQPWNTFRSENAGHSHRHAERGPRGRWPARGSPTSSRCAIGATDCRDSRRKCRVPCTRTPTATSGAEVTPLSKAAEAPQVAAVARPRERSFP